MAVEPANGKAAFQMILPTSEMLFDVAGAIEQTASQALGIAERRRNPRLI